MHTCWSTTRDGTIQVHNWENSNKLLSSGFCGVKTGVTQTAGPCLAEAFKYKDTTYVIILLQSKTLDHRWAEAVRLVQWAIALQKEKEYKKTLAQPQNRRV